MATDILDPTPLDLAIWELYLVAREVKSGPLAPFVRGVSNAIGFLFPDRRRRLVSASYCARHRELMRQRYAKWAEAHPEELRAYRAEHNEEYRALGRAHYARHRERLNRESKARRIAKRATVRAAKGAD